MIGARYRNTPESDRYCDNCEYYISTLAKLIEGSADIINGRRLLTSLYENHNKHNVNIGLIQKLVNMSVKYLFVIESCELFEKRAFHIHIDEENCDCPLDSKILKRMESDTGKKFKDASILSFKINQFIDNFESMVIKFLYFGYN